MSKRMFRHKVWHRLRGHTLETELHTFNGPPPFPVVICRTCGCEWADPFFISREGLPE